MRKFKHNKVLLYAAAIILVCVAALAVSVHVAFGAEENKVLTEQGKSHEPVLTTKIADTDIESEQLGPQFITEQEAIDSFMNIALNVFKLDIDQEVLTATFNPKCDIIDENGDVVYTTHDEWSVSCSICGASIDAISGDVTGFCDLDPSYKGESITQAAFSSMASRLGGASSDDPENSSNIYIKTAADIVNATLADGRKIDHIWIDGVQFIDNNSSGAGSLGTLQVDCHIYMDMGNSYTLSFRGTSELLLTAYYSHPTWEACSGFYYYEEDAGPWG